MWVSPELYIKLLAIFSYTSTITKRQLDQCEVSCLILH